MPHEGLFYARLLLNRDQHQLERDRIRRDVEQTKAEVTETLLESKALLREAERVLADRRAARRVFQWQHSGSRRDMRSPCPLISRKQTLIDASEKSALCHYQKLAGAPLRLKLRSAMPPPRRRFGFTAEG